MKQQVHFLLFRKTFLIGCLFLISLMGWGQTYNYTFIAGVFTSGTNPETKTLNSNDWTLSTNPIGANFRGYDSTKGQQFGSGSTPATTATLSTSGISGTITSVKISTSGAASIVGTVAVSVGGNNYGTSNSISSTNTLYTFNGTSSGQIIISWSQSSSKAFYIKNIEITYASTPTVTFDKNAVDATGTMTNQIASTATNLTTNSFARVGYAFSNWNTLANGTGTSYANNASFPFSANATLYAQWTPISPPTATAATNEGSSSFTANWNAVSGATSYEIDVFTIQTTSNSNVASWTFPLSGTTVTPDSFSANNSSKNLTTNASAISNSSVSSNYAASATNWTDGNAIKYWQIEINSTGFENLILSSKQKSSNSGPRDFKIQYNIGSTWVDVQDSTITVANDDFISGVKTNLTLPSDCNNKTNLQIRWIMTSNTSVVNAGLSDLGTSRIDDIIITGDLLSTTFVTGYNALNTGNVTSYLISGLTPNTTYYYNVRTVNGSASANSNTITANTINDIATADFRSLTTGDFSTASSWQFDAGTVSGWINATQAPTSANNITIQSPHIITLSQNVSVNASKTLAIASGGTLTVGTGKILTISGTLNNNGSIIFKSDATGNGMLGVFSGTLSGTGSATVERYIAQGKRAFRFLAPGVTTTNFIKYNWQEATHITGSTTGANGFDQTASGGSSMFTYNNQVASGTGWTAIANTNATNLEAQKGYRLLIRGDRTPSLITAATADNMNTAITLSATGTLKTGTVTIDATSTPVATNNTSNGTTNGFSLVGNPYVSPIDWHNVTKTNLTDTYYIWDTNVGTAAQRGRYVSYSQATGINNYGNTGVSTADRYLQAGQAFFVKNTTLGTPSSLVFNESNKAATSPFVLRTNNQNTSLSVLLYAPSDLAIGGYPMDGITSVFGTNFDAQIGYGDVLKLESSGENLAWFTQTKKLDINAQSPVVDTDVLLIKSLRLGSNKSYTFRIKATNFDTSLTGYLVDNYLNTQQVIDFTQDYFANFSTTADAQSFGEDRFKIVFSTALNNNQFTKDTFVVYPNPVVNNQFTIKLPATLSGNVKVTLHNLLGQEVFQVNTIASPILEIAPKNTLSSGVYIVSVMGEGISSQQKITIQ
jgi:hypothetical protein